MSSEYAVSVYSLDFLLHVEDDPAVLKVVFIGKLRYNMTIEKEGDQVKAEIRPSSDLRNHYSEISKKCRESREPVVITVNGRGDTVVLGLQQYNQMTAELELLRSLAEAQEDVKNGRIETVQGTFDDIRAALNAGR